MRNPAPVSMLDAGLLVLVGVAVGDGVGDSKAASWTCIGKAAAYVMTTLMISASELAARVVYSCPGWLEPRRGPRIASMKYETLGRPWT
ncbi:hypothetical protein DFH29DRAFT_916574 [Suillus ampliporus]|nr:hypothetical protein DFH29DRAFT_916574 [Suillus ampliporus]